MDTPSSTPRSGVRVESRFIPFPRSVSVQALSALERLVNEAGVPLNALQSFPRPDDVEGWRQLRTAADDYYESAFKRIAPNLRSTVETVHAGSATVHVATPMDPARPECCYLDFHGGALIMGGGMACRTGAQQQADQHGVSCYSVDYRMPPEHPFPAALDDSMAAYRHVLERHRPSDVIVGGRSAGGNLAAAMLLRARDEGLPMPQGLVLLSPEVDLTESGDSFELNRTVDVVLPKSLMEHNRLYADGADLSHPYLSPLFGDLSAFPPTFIQSGTRDLFLSNAVRMHRALRRAGAIAELHVFEGMPHGGFMGGTPEDQELTDEVNRFVREHFAAGGPRGSQRVFDR